ncbi:DUF6891 domain-containing protein [uncultured Sphingomonas sp.]|uniref:DUF6891 domain-containing protein n=1 Tax=uncultured Sphingomonas sp. TaxID=158754 RepID=UPI0037486397
MRRLLALLRGRQATPTPPEPVRVEAPSPDLDDLREFIRREVAGGFYDDDAVLRNAADVYGDELDPDILRSNAQAFLREALRDHRAAQATWPEETDCDRLEAAFDALEAQGVVCRQNFTCCGTCGAAEIGDEMDAIEAAGFDVRGYAFYHAQDTEAAVDGGGLYLNYGAVEDDDDASLAIGRLVADELAAHGLTVTWSGNLATRIGISLDWKRRR